MLALERYWAFALFCIAVMIFMFRLVVRERVTLQASLSFLFVLVLTAVCCIVPEPAIWVSHLLGFTLPSNFFLAFGILALAFLHLTSLVHLSRVQLRSVTLTQELAMVQEKLDRVSARLDEQERAREEAVPSPTHVDLSRRN